jgi:peptidyl-prolyl cis-trans isomerase SurA
MKIATIGLNCLFSGALLALVACNSSNSAIKEGAKAGEGTQLATEANTETTEAAKEEKTELAKVITKTDGVQNRGAYIKILVNKTPITNFDIQRRAKFLALRRVPGNPTKPAENEMIEQARKLQEAKLRRRTATTAQVDAAFANFAKQNRASPKILSQQLGKLGVGSTHFKEFIKTQISWQRTVQGKFQSETSRVSEQQAITQLRESGNQKPKVNEYSFKQVIFVVPKNKRSKSALAARTREANAFRKTVSGCDTLLQSIKSLKDVSLIDRRHIMEPELPENWKSAISKASVGGTTPAQETEKGAEFMAICSSKTVDDDRAAQVTKQSTDFTQFGEQSGDFSKKYLNELRKNATIVYQ